MSLIDPSQPITSSSGYDVYVRSITSSGATAQLQAIDGGLHVTASLMGITGDLDFDCTSWACALLGGDSSGGFSVNSVVINADLWISVRPDHRSR